MKKENLNRGKVQSIQLSNGDTVRVEMGILWLTFEGEQGDIILRRGDIWKAPGRGQVVIQAMTDASFSLDEKVRKTLTNIARPWRTPGHPGLVRN